MGGQLWALVAGDYSGDDALDLLVTSDSTNDVSVLLHAPGIRRVFLPIIMRMS